MRIREATDTDGDGVAAVIQEVFGEYEGCVFDRSAEFADLDRAASRFTAVGGAFWVVEGPDGRIAGCVGVAPVDEDGTFELHRFYLRVDVRGSGTAVRLLALAIRHVREHGGQRLVLWTDTRFLQGQRFYERHGFVRLPGTRTLGDLSHSTEYRYVLTLDRATPAGAALSASRSGRSPIVGEGSGALWRASPRRHKRPALLY